jgi:hypothetical protein
MKETLKEWFNKFLKLFEHDITSEIKERVTNPFFVTFFLSWIGWNWQLVFTLINFDTHSALNEKIILIQEYLNHHSFQGTLLWWPVCTAFKAIVIFALLNQCALFISVLVRRQVRPLIYKWVGHKDIVDINTHKEVKERLFRVQEAFVEMEQTTTKATTENSILKKERQDAKEKFIQLEADILELKNTENKERNIHSLENFFEGRWYNEYIFPDGTTGEEPVDIKEGTKYFANGKYIFDLDMIEVRQDNGTLKFRKVGIGNDKRRAVNDLIIINESEYRGIEDKNIIITYTRIDDGSQKLSFKPAFLKTRISIGEITSINFKLRNNTNINLEILSYQFTTYYGGLKLSVGDKQEYILNIGGNSDKIAEFNKVDPIEYYFKNKKVTGVFDAEITLEYRIDGTSDIRSITRVARLIVTNQSSIIVSTAQYGFQDKFFDVTERLKEFVTNNTTEFMVDNGVLGGDPYPGKKKALHVSYTINGAAKTTTVAEGSLFKFK